MIAIPPIDAAITAMIVIVVFEMLADVACWAVAEVDAEALSPAVVAVTVCVDWDAGAVITGSGESVT